MGSNIVGMVIMLIGVFSPDFWYSPYIGVR